MAVIPETGFLVLADLSGYSAYLSRSEIEHAPLIAGDLLETVVGRLDPPFRLSKFEGDAAFLYVEDGRAEASLLLDAIEAAYVAFRRRLRSIDQATSCECNSCRLAPRLDLKLIVHHGTFVRSRIAGREELAGADVILVHRLLKGATAKRKQGTGFALYTEAAADALGLSGSDLLSVPGDEAIEHLGSVRTFAVDLEARWLVDRDRRVLDPAPGPVIVDLSATLDADPATVWAHLTSPALRARWEGALIIEDEPGARRGVGTATRCITGRLAMLEEVVDWEPYDHVGWRIAVAGIGPVEAVADLVPSDGGTRLRLRWSAAGEPRLDAATVAEVRSTREAAFARLVRVLSPVTAGS
jgi:hypothetical protein